MRHRTERTDKMNRQQLGEKVSRGLGDLDKYRKLRNELGLCEGFGFRRCNTFDKPTETYKVMAFGSVIKTIRICLDCLKRINRKAV